VTSEGRVAKGEPRATAAGESIGAATVVREPGDSPAGAPPRTDTRGASPLGPRPSTLATLEVSLLPRSSPC
jgi:hypothetical protein